MGLYSLCSNLIRVNEALQPWLYFRDLDLVDFVFLFVFFEGLDQVMSGELLEFEDKTIGIALNLENDNVGVVLMGTGRQILEGGTGLSCNQSEKTG